MEKLWKIFELFVKIVSLNPNYLRINRFFNRILIFAFLSLILSLPNPSYSLLNTNEHFSIEENMRVKLITELYIIAVGHVILKGFYIFLYRDEFYELLDWMKNLQHREFDALLQDQVKKYTSMANEYSQKLLRYIVLLYSFAGLSVTVDCLIYNPVEIVPFIPTSNPSYNVYSYFIQISISTFAICFMIFYDILPLLTGLHIICMSFTIREGVKELKIFRATEAEEEVSREKNSRLLKVIHMLHCEFLIQLNRFCDVFSMLALIQLTTSFLFLLLLLYGTNELSNTLILKVALLCAVCEIFMICFLGQIVAMKTEDIYNDFCQTNWYEMSIADQKHFLLCLQMAQRNYGLRAGGIYNIDLNMFLQVCSVKNLLKN
uniref:Odorant receptor n=1 Tax=Lutzomyia longipalpis TaxID=7200 RepID=A0A7G3AER1_LUTLO